LNNGIFYVKDAVLLVYPVMDSESGYAGIVENNGLKMNIEIRARYRKRSFLKQNFRMPYYLLW